MILHHDYIGHVSCVYMQMILVAFGSNTIKSGKFPCVLIPSPSCAVNFKNDFKFLIMCAARQYSKLSHCFSTIERQKIDRNGKLNCWDAYGKLFYTHINRDWKICTKINVELAKYIPGRLVIMVNLRGGDENQKFSTLNIQKATK